MGVTTTGSHPKALWPGVKSWFGASYNQHPLEYPMLFNKQTSDKAYEERVESTGFSLVPIKTQGASVSYTSDSQGYLSRMTNVTFALGYIVTMEELQDNLYEAKAFPRAKKLANAFRITKEIVGANIFNRAFDSNYPGGDGVSLISASHPTVSGTQSNLMTTAADISEGAIEDLVTQVMAASDSAGNKISVMPQTLAVPPGLWFEANRILKSTLQNDTANNAPNVLKMTNALPGGIVMDHWFSDSDAWFILTDQEGLIYQERMALEFSKDNDFDTNNAKAKAVERYVFGWDDWRGIFGSPGG